MSQQTTRAVSTAMGTVAVVLWCAPAGATDFHVLEAHAGYELHSGGGGHGSYGLGYTFDTLVTAPSLRGVEVGGRFDVLHCPACDRTLDGAALVLPVLVTFWKEDLSPVTFYFGPAFGFGYSRATEKFFAMGELEAALQIRSIYDGLWVRPILFGGIGGAYDGYASLGLRIVVGYSPNHGVRTTEPPEPPPRSGNCDPPPSADLAAGEPNWVVPYCYRSNVSVRLDGKGVAVSDRSGDLVIGVGAAASGTTQQVEIFLAGGSFSVQLRRR